MDEQRLQWFCIGHWMKCLYSDFLHERVAGIEIPCSSCDMKEECNTCPVINFIPLIEKSGIKIEIGFSPEKNRRCQS